MDKSIANIKHQLYEELELGVRTTGRLLARIAPEQWGYRPSESVRTLRELAHHLAAIPVVDVAIGQESPGSEVRWLEQRFEAMGDDAGALAEAMKKGAEQLKRYFDAMPDEEFLSRATKPFYADHPTVQVRWLIESTTHIFHHRSQLFTYLKLLGHDVNMMDLYAG